MQYMEFLNSQISELEGKAVKGGWVSYSGAYSYGGYTSSGSKTAPAPANGTQISITIPRAGNSIITDADVSTIVGKFTESAVQVNGLPGASGWVVVITNDTDASASGTAFGTTGTDTKTDYIRFTGASNDAQNLYLSGFIPADATAYSSYTFKTNKDGAAVGSGTYGDTAGNIIIDTDSLKNLEPLGTAANDFLKSVQSASTSST